MPEYILLLRKKDSSFILIFVQRTKHKITWEVAIFAFGYHNRSGKKA